MNNKDESSYPICPKCSKELSMYSEWYDNLLSMYCGNRYCDYILKIPTTIRLDPPNDGLL